MATISCSYELKYQFTQIQSGLSVSFESYKAIISYSNNTAPSSCNALIINSLSLSSIFVTFFLPLIGTLDLSVRLRFFGGAESDNISHAIHPQPIGCVLAVMLCGVPTEINRMIRILLSSSQSIGWHDGLMVIGLDADALIDFALAIADVAPLTMSADHLPSVTEDMQIILPPPRVSAY